MADEQNSGTQTGTTEQNTANGGQQVVLQKIYLKDLSFESPKAPEVFTTNVTPQTQLNLRYANKDLGQDNVEVALTVTIEAKQDDATLFLVEMTQAGVFTIRGYTAEQRSNIVGSFCPNALYPFAREAIADVIQKGGFPQLLLQPINFDALYAQALQERAAQAGAAAATAPAETTTGEPH
jgi:preprotein translocase subunit SecB